MFCTKCGKQLPEESQFCPGCGNRIGSVQASGFQPEVKVVLDPNEVVPQKSQPDSGSTFAGQGRTIGMILMIISIIGDLVAMFAIGFDAFIPITIGAMVLFVIGFFLRMFCP